MFKGDELPKGAKESNKKYKRCAKNRKTLDKKTDKQNLRNLFRL